MRRIFRNLLSSLAEAMAVLHYRWLSVMLHRRTVPLGDAPDADSWAERDLSNGVFG